MKVAADRWEVLLNVPRDVGDLGLHQPEDLAAAHFRRQLAEELGPDHAARVGPAAEQQFRQARAVHAGRPVLWGGFIMTATPAGAGVAPDTSRWPTEPAERALVAELAATNDALLVSLTVGVRELTLPDLPASPAALVSRAIKARFGERARVHLVSYGDVDGVAVVRTEDVGRQDGDGPAAPGVVGEHVLAEVNLLFPDAEAMVTVTAATPNGGAVNDAVLLAGSLARGVRLRSAADGDGSPGPAAGSAAAAGAPGVVLPDGRLVPAGLTLLGRRPTRTAELPADHTVALPDDSVSRTHLAIRVVDGTATATDLHSTNGTLVRRRGGVVALVPGEDTPLEAGDELHVGAAVIRVVGRPAT